MVALDGCFFKWAVQARDLSVGPGMARLGEAMRGAVRGANTVKNAAKGPGLAGRTGEMNAVVGQYRMHPVRPLGQHPTQKAGGGHFGGLWLQLGNRDLAGAVNSHKQALAACSGLHFGKIDALIAPGGVVLEFLFGYAQPAPSERLELWAVCATWQPFSR